MDHKTNSRVIQLVALFLLLMLSSQVTLAQTTAFTYQGRLTDAGNPANGTYDTQFKLFDAANAGAQVGLTITNPSVTATNGLFTVTLDFGAAAFPGADRFLEINLRPAGNQGGYQQLLPRQKVMSTPYALQSLNAASAANATNATNAATAVNFSGALAGDVTGTQSATTIANSAVTTAKLADSSVTNTKIVSVDGSKITGTIPVAAVPAGSANYIQNATTPQAASNFNISGNGTAGGTLSGNIVNVTTQYNLGGSRILSLGPNTGVNNLLAGSNAGNALTNGRENTFIGSGAGQATTGGLQICPNCGPPEIYEGSHNVFSGYRAGYSNTTGFFNSFSGAGAGYSNTTGVNNSFYGASAGYSNTTGTFNSFYGVGAGYSNTTGGNNSFYGVNAGYFNTTGGFNSFSGASAGYSNTTGENNSFSGAYAGYSNTSGSRNSFFGFSAGQANTTGNNNSFFGFSAGQDNTTGISNSFYGGSAGLSNTTGTFNSFYGAGAGRSNTTGRQNSFSGANAGNSNTTGWFNSFSGYNAGASNTTGNNNTALGQAADFGSNALDYATAIGSNARADCSFCLVLGGVNGVNGASASTNVGIGTTAPKSKLEVRGGNIFIAQPNSLIITSPNGSCWFLAVNDAGALFTIPTTCP